MAEGNESAPGTGWYDVGGMARDLAQMVLEVDTPPCKHEWRQYMDIERYNVPEEHRDDYLIKDGQPIVGTDFPNGFFCIHCMERSDGKDD